MSLNRITNEPYFEIIIYPELVDSSRGYMSIELEESFELISELRSKEYLCTGVCYCEEEVENMKRSFRSTTNSRSLKYVVGAATSIIAFNYARLYFQDVCLNSEFSEDSGCSSVEEEEHSRRIRTEIDDCKEIIQKEPVQVPLPLGEEFLDHLFLDESESESSAEIGKRNQEISSCEGKVTVVYSDGSCCDNGKPTARGGIGVYFGDGDQRNIARRLPGKQTNNRAELTAILDSINSVPDHCDVEVRTDSLYGMHVAAGLWKATENIDLINHIKQRIQERKGKVSFVKVKGHSGEKDGNYYADLLAMEGAEMDLP